MKEQILQAASAYFTQYGTKGASMDDIARSIGISKKTIYEYFKDKETLFVESVRFDLQRYRKQLVDIGAGGEDVLDIMIKASMYAFKTTFRYCPLYFKDIDKYPEASRLVKEHLDFMHEKTLAYFSKAVDEGFFKSDNNYEVISGFVRNQIDSIRKNPALNQMKKMEMYAVAILTMFNGLCTEKGRKELEKYNAEQLFKSEY